MQHSFLNNAADRLAEIEQRRQVTEVIIQKVTYILSKTEADGLRWKGTKTDLLELLQVVYLHGALLKPDGTPMTMSYLCTTCFSILGLTLRKGYRATIQRASVRKGVKAVPITDRLQFVMFRSHGNRTLNHQRFWEELL